MIFWAGMEMEALSNPTIKVGTSHSAPHTSTGVCPAGCLFTARYILGVTAISSRRLHRSIDSLLLIPLLCGSTHPHRALVRHLPAHTSKVQSSCFSSGDSESCAQVQCCQRAWDGQTPALPITEPYLTDQISQWLKCYALVLPIVQYYGSILIGPVAVPLLCLGWLFVSTSIGNSAPYPAPNLEGRLHAA